MHGYLICGMRQGGKEKHIRNSVNICDATLLLSQNHMANLGQGHSLLKRNKYVGILSIAVTTLQYITISMITIFSMYIAHVRSGSGRNSYQGHVNDSGEFWRVLGCTRIRHH